MVGAVSRNGGDTYASADDHQFLLGRPDYTAVRRAQPTVKKQR